MEFDTLDRRSGIAIFDPVENVRFELYTENRPSIEPTETAGFYFPIDAAVGFETGAIEVPNHLSVVVRTQDGSIVTDATTFDGLSLPFDAYLLEVQSTPMKLYIAVEGSLSLDHGETSAMIRFDERRRVRIGARSFHDQPAGTITVTDDIEDAMAALSLLGSALKTTSCERSFPTLRGHPPVIEFGESFDVPSDIERPETGVELVVPPERQYVYPAASLAYYLGAELVAGGAPRLRVGEFEHSLSGPDGYEAAVNRTLRQVFFLDCLTRTEGYYPVELHERERVEPLVDLDFTALYGQPLAKQLPEYLSIPFETLRPHVPDWHLTTDVVPTVETLPALPYFADELSLLRTPRDPATYTSRPKPKMFDDFTRTAAVAAGDFTRSTADAWDWGEDELFQIERADTIEHAWVGNGYPIGANKVSIESLRQRVDYTAPDDSALKVHVVCNDVAMDEENVVGQFYGLRDFVAFDVSIHEETTTDELATLFQSEADFIHYIGHVDDSGFHCTDGCLDANTLPEVNVDAFLLNACRSYRQGTALVEKGSKGGVVTLAEVINSSATKIGRSLARLLNCGFSLRSALSIAKEELAGGVEYITVGDGGVTLCQSESGAPTMFRVSRDGEEFLLEHSLFPTANYGLGSITSSEVEQFRTRYLASDSFMQFRLSADEFEQSLELELLPVKIDGELYWSDELSIDDV
ncbi:hypothetical protein [Haladaptatus sp. DYF46]|uniref:hypothetical protein n=1 Tax=Haladaptatus sp. DYF46 TaxID=2886041 RepID=UPI001E35DB27|nr:hypothetical protein [Haladaptatus sp. DYF46]